MLWLHGDDLLILCAYCLVDLVALLAELVEILHVQGCSELLHFLSLVTMNGGGSLARSQLQLLLASLTCVVSQELLASCSGLLLFDLGVYLDLAH